MIALFFDQTDRARRLGEGLRAPWSGVDGPFRVFGGGLGDTEARLYAVESGADGAYAAARSAARRGARLLLPIMSCVCSERLARDRDWGLGTFHHITAVHDLGGLGPLLRLLPDSAASFPIRPDALVPSDPIWQGEAGGDGVSAGTLPWATRCPLLLEWLAGERRVGLVDLQLAGYAAAAVELGLPMRPVGVITSMLGRDGLLTASYLEIERAVDDALEQLIDR